MKPVKCLCGDDAQPIKSGGKWAVMCYYICSSCTPYVRTRADAIRVWNRMQKEAKR